MRTSVGFEVGTKGGDGLLEYFGWESWLSVSWGFDNNSYIGQMIEYKSN